MRNNIRSDEGQMLETSALIATLAVNIINSVEKTMISCYTSLPTQHHSFFRNLPSLFNGIEQRAQKLVFVSQTAFGVSHQLHNTVGFVFPTWFNKNLDLTFNFCALEAETSRKSMQNNWHYFLLFYLEVVINSYIIFQRDSWSFIVHSVWALEI